MPYQEQFDRVKRLLLKIDPQSNDHGNQLEYEDNLWYFFQSSWHLKDWIKNDEAVQKFDIEKIIKNYIHLQVCADLANRTKHYKLDYKRLAARHSGTDVTVSLPTIEIDYMDLKNFKIPYSIGSESTYVYHIEDKSGIKYQAIELAKQIILEWEDIISKYVR